MADKIGMCAYCGATLPTSKTRLILTIGGEVEICEDCYEYDPPKRVKVKSRKAIVPPPHTHDKGTDKR